MNWTSSKAPPQGTVQLRAIRLVLNALVCEPRPGTNPLASTSALACSARTRQGDGAEPRRPVRLHLSRGATARPGACSAMHAKLNDLDDPGGNAAAYTAPSDCRLRRAFYEVFKYFGGYTNPALAAGAATTAGSPVGAYGLRQPSDSRSADAVDDPAAFRTRTAATTRARSPATAPAATTTRPRRQHVSESGDGRGVPTRFDG